MKKVMLLVTLVMVFAISAVSAQHPVYSDLPDLEGRELTVAIENLYPPFQFEDSRAEAPIGFDYDLINEICYRLNCVPVYEVTSFDVQIAAVGEGQYDLGANGLSIREEREEIVDFTDPYVTLDTFLLVREGEEGFTNIDEFLANPELLLGVQAGNANFFLAQGYVEQGLLTEDRIVVFNGFAELIQSLVNGDVDAVPADASATSGFVNASGAPVELIGESLDSDNFGLIFPEEGSDELVAAFNAALETMRADGYLDYLAYKWLVVYTPQAVDA
ncbi:MAG: basic amino acid ABC transporter substrate-binding protein [Anaerolineae bacterium]